MNGRFANEPMLDMFIYETTQLIEQLEQLIIDNEKSNGYTESAMNEIFRIMHTIKGSAAMMLYDGISTLAHSIEDLFFFLREEQPAHVDYPSLTDLVLETVDFIKVELAKIKDGVNTEEKPLYLIENINTFLAELKGDQPQGRSRKESPEAAGLGQRYYVAQDKDSINQKKNAFKATLFFEEDCGMENLRAYTVIHNLQDLTHEYYHFPVNIMEDESSIQEIKDEGFRIFLKADCDFEQLQHFFMQTALVKEIKLTQIDDAEYVPSGKHLKQGLPDENASHTNQSRTSSQSMISVNISKLDKLMDLVGELVISEAMVTQNPDLIGLELDNFQKSARQLGKITHELQDIVMSIRMFPLATTFLKMHRIVRDMCRKLGKEVELRIIGEDTEVDKNIIERISDPLMHLVRNALDHGMEFPEERLEKGKSPSGVVTLEAKNAGSDVLVMVRDDGKGLNREKILFKAKESGLLSKPVEEMTDKEVYNLIFLPGFSTNENITEFSGRGVGMDVVLKNIESIGGSLSVDSIPDAGTTITIKIPLTLAIIDGMNIRVGSSCYTIPTMSIRESFKPQQNDIIRDSEGQEMIMVRGQCYPILRLHEHFKIKNAETQFTKGIFVMVENNDRMFCIFVDHLLGKQQVVVKALPSYIRKMKRIKGLAGCTLLGDGSISLILDVAELLGM